MFEKVLFASLILQVTQAVAKTCTEASDSSQTGQCKKGKCISIGEDSVCTDCARPGEVPINGECKDKTDGLITTAGCEKADGALDEQSTTCEKCTKAGYFLHKGCCYAQATPPGQTICKSAGSSAGLCETCNDVNGFFKNAGASDNTHQSCIACNEAEAVDGFRGIPNCKVCTSPVSPGYAICTGCEGDYYLLAGSPISCVEKTQCKTDHFPTTVEGIKKCIACGDAEAGGIADCETCALKEARMAEAPVVTCNKCAGGKVPDGDGSACVNAPEPSPSDCLIENCQKCSADNQTCEECKSGYFNNPAAKDTTKQSCIACNEAEAVDGFRGIPNCKVCTSPVSPGYAICTGCEGDYYLLAGSPISCVEKTQCKTDHFPTTVEGIKKCIACGDAEAGGIADCETCALKEARMAEAPVVTCNKCAGGKVPDGDGSACVNAPEPSPSDCLIENCQKCSADNQTCEECKSGYFNNPAAKDTTKQSCIACNEAEAVDGFRGIPNCKVCTSPVSPGYAICTGCEGDYYLLAGSPISCVEKTQCKTDHFPTTVEGIKKCIACGDAEAGGIADCETCALKEARMAEAPVVTCNKCAGGKVPDGDGSACVNAPEPSPSDCLIENCQKCSADNQTCEECKSGYFNNPAAKDTTKQSCIACNEAEAVDGFRGIPNCKVCTSPVSPGYAICTGCEGDYYLLAGSPISCVEKTQCKTDHFPTTVEGIKKCIACGDAEAGGIADCETCALKEARMAEAPVVTCNKCAGGKVPDGDGSACVNAPEPSPSDCLIENCQKCSADNQTCEECKSGYFNNPAAKDTTKQSCIACNEAEAVDGFRGIPNCKVCTSPVSPGYAICTGCEGDYYLLAGSPISCVEKTQCKTDHFPTTVEGIKKCIACGDAEAGGIADCETCALKEARMAEAPVVTCNKCAGGKVPDGDGSACVNAPEPSPSDCLIENCQKCSADNQTCEECKSGYFNNPAAKDTTKQSCIACNEAEAVDGFRGIPNCKVCTSPVSPGYAICTGCEGDYYLLAGSPISCVEKTQCKTDHFPTTVEGIKKCIACGDAEAGGIADCETCALKEARMAEAPVVTCNKCAGGKVPDGDGSACVNAPEPSPSDCLIENCQKCSADNQTCEECKDMNYLTPTRMCVSDCATIPGYYGADGNPKTCKPCEVTDCATCNPQGQCETCKDGYYKNGAACAKCDNSCKTCANGDPNGCTSCGSSKALKYEGAGNTGTCGEGCKPVSGGTDGTCKTCGLSIDGTSYCSVCNTDKEYPESGVCVKKSARTASCQAEPSGGVCGTCAKGFFRIDGGCYETAKFPGKSVCADANADADTCKTPVPGYKIEAGKLVTCSEGCDTCSDANTCTKCKDGYVLTTSKCTPCSAGCATCTNTASACDTCSTGYYKSGLKCIACDKDDSAIKGISNCLNCAPPSAGSGSVLCYLMKGGDSTGGSTNRSGLSTGAIAGIAVAVVVVVGGLVGFLCWWFLCRGKA